MSKEDSLRDSLSCFITLGVPMNLIVLYGKFNRDEVRRRWAQLRRILNLPSIPYPLTFINTLRAYANVLQAPSNLVPYIRVKGKINADLATELFEKLYFDYWQFERPGDDFAPAWRQIVQAMPKRVASSDPYVNLAEALFPSETPKLSTAVREQLDSMILAREKISEQSKDMFARVVEQMINGRWSTIQNPVDHRLIDAALNMLEPKRKSLLVHRFGFGCNPKTYAELSRIYKVSASMIRSAEWHALDSLKRGNKRALILKASRSSLADRYLELGSVADAESEKVVEKVIKFAKLTTEQFLDTETRHLDFSQRTTNCLLNADIRTGADLVRRTPRDLMGTKNFGRVCLQEVVQYLSEYGLELRVEHNR